MSDVVVNGRSYPWPKVAAVAICLDGCEPEYLEVSIAQGLMPVLQRIRAQGTDRLAHGGGGGGGIIAGNGGGSVGGGGSLPFTGADILAMSVGGGILVAAGGGALVAGRRRRSVQIA